MEQISLYFKNELSNNFSIDSSTHKIFNSSSKHLSNFFENSKFIVSPKKQENINTNTTKEKTVINSVKRSFKNKKK